MNDLVIEVDSKKSWAGFGPTGKNKNMFKWIHDTWDDD